MCYFILPDALIEKHEMIEIDNAIELLSNEYPEFCVHAQMKLKLSALKSSITRNKFDAHFCHLNSELIFPKDGFISLEFLEIIKKRFDEVLRLCDEARQVCYNDESDLIRIKDIKALKGDGIKQRQIINSIENIFVMLPQLYNNTEVHLESATYCWYFGNWVDPSFYEAEKHFKALPELIPTKFDPDVAPNAAEEARFRLESYLESKPYGHQGKERFSINGSLYKLDRDFYLISTDCITVKRAYINDPERIYIDEVWGGAFIEFPPQARFYGDVVPEISVTFNDIFVNKAEYAALIAKPEKTKKERAHDTRNGILRRVISEGMIPSLLESDDITSTLTQSELWDAIGKLSQLTKEERGSFSRGWDDFFKRHRNPEISNIIRFQLGTGARNKSKQ